MLPHCLRTGFVTVPWQSEARSHVEIRFDAPFSGCFRSSSLWMSGFFHHRYLLQDTRA